jgi:hypothetical protein
MIIMSLYDREFQKQDPEIHDFVVDRSTHIPTMSLIFCSFFTTCIAVSENKRHVHEALVCEIPKVYSVRCMSSVVSAALVSQRVLTDLYFKPAHLPSSRHLLQLTANKTIQE